MVYEPRKLIKKGQNLSRKLRTKKNRATDKTWTNLIHWNGKRKRIYPEHMNEVYLNVNQERQIILYFHELFFYYFWRKCQIVLYHQLFLFFPFFFELFERNLNLFRLNRTQFSLEKSNNVINQEKTTKFVVTKWSMHTHTRVVKNDQCSNDLFRWYTQIFFWEVINWVGSPWLFM